MIRQKSESILRTYPGSLGYESRARKFFPWFYEVNARRFEDRDGDVAHWPEYTAYRVHSIEFKRWMGVMRGQNLERGFLFANWRSDADINSTDGYGAYDSWVATSEAMRDVYASRILNFIANNPNPGELPDDTDTGNTMRLELTLKSSIPSKDTVQVNPVVPSSGPAYNHLVVEFNGLAYYSGSQPYDLLLNIECSILGAPEGVVGTVEVYDFTHVGNVSEAPEYGWTEVRTEDTNAPDGHSTGVTGQYRSYRSYGFYMPPGSGVVTRDSRRTFVAPNKAQRRGAPFGILHQFVNPMSSDSRYGQMWVRLKHTFPAGTEATTAHSLYDLVQVIPVKRETGTSLVAASCEPPMNTGSLTSGPNSPSNPLVLTPAQFASNNPLTLTFNKPVHTTALEDEVNTPIRLYRYTGDPLHPFADATCGTVQTVAPAGKPNSVEVRWKTPANSSSIGVASPGTYMLTSHDAEATFSCSGAFSATMLRSAGTLGPAHGPFTDLFRVYIEIVGDSTNPCGTNCAADVDDGTNSGTPDGGVGIEDLLYYLYLYDAGAPAADVDDGTGSCTTDGGVGIEDLLFYLYRYDAGC